MLAIRAAPQLVPISIQESCALKIIDGPVALKTFVAMLRTQFFPRPGCSTSLWIANVAAREGLRAEAAGHIRYPQISAGALAYVQHSGDSELREWTNAVFLPHAVFKRICSAVTTATTHASSLLGKNDPLW